MEEKGDSESGSESRRMLGASPAERSINRPQNGHLDWSRSIVMWSTNTTNPMAFQR